MRTSDSAAGGVEGSGVWPRGWQDQGLGINQVLYRKGIKRNDQLTGLVAALSDPALKLVGIVVDTVDDIVHGPLLGKRWIGAQIIDIANG